MGEIFRDLRYYQLSVGIVAAVLKLGMDLFTTISGEPLWRFKIWVLMHVKAAMMAWHVWG